MTSVEYLIVGGGGGGSLGGGGGGGFLAGTFNSTEISSTEIVVGERGFGRSDGTRGTNGNPSKAFNLTAVGGGGGGALSSSTDTSSANPARGLLGGSGGGGGTNTNVGYSDSGGNGTTDQGFFGGSGNKSYKAGGGGGGAGAGGAIPSTHTDSSGTHPIGGKGGVGLSSAITGASVFYAGGGGGGVRESSAGFESQGGAGGGGNGGYTVVGSLSKKAPVAGVANSGGGGGGGSKDHAGANGGSGIVVLRFEAAVATQLAVTTNAPPAANSGSVLSPSPVVEVRDVGGIKVPNASDSITASIASGPTGWNDPQSPAILTGDFVQAQSGVATFSNLTITGPVGDYTLDFTSGNLTKATSQSISLTIGVPHGPTSALLVSSASIPADGTSTSVITIQAKDSAGNSFTLSAGTVTLAATLGTLSAVTNNNNGTYTATLTSSGTQTGTAVISGDIAGSAFSTATVTITPLAQDGLAITSTEAVFDGTGYTIELQNSGGSGDGAVTYAHNGGSANGCQISGSTLTASSAGTCFVTATKAAEGPYESVTSPQATVTFQKAPRTLSFGGRPSSVTLEYGDLENFVATPSLGAGVVTYGVSGTGCTVINATTRAVEITSSTAACTLSATIAADANYESASVELNISGTARAITITGGSPSVSFGSSFTPTALSQDCQQGPCPGSLVRLEGVDNTQTQYTYEGIQGTVYGPSATPPTNAGRYHVLPSNLVITGGSASNYNITYQPGTLSIGKVSRTLAFTSPSSLNLQYGGTATVVAAPSVGDGAITYSVGSSTACSVDSSGVVTVTSASGTCELSSTIAAGTNHLTATTSSSVTVTVSTRPITVSVTPQSVIVGGVVSSTPTVTSGALQLSDTLSSATFTYEGTGSTTYSASTTAPTAVGTYSVTPSVAVFGSGLASNYVISYTAGTLEIVAAPPPVVVSGGGGASPAPEAVAPVENPREPRTPRALPVGPNTSSLGAGIGLNAPAGATIEGTLSQGVPAPEINRQTGELPDLSAGQSLATSAGIPETVSITAIPDAGIVVMEGADWVISVVLGTSNGSVENAEGTVLLSMAQASGGSATGSGFLPGTLATVWLFSEPTLAATVTVDDNGEFSAEFLVDARLIAPGEHTLQIQGVGTDGYIKAANLGVLVEQPVELTTESASGLLWWVLGFFGLVLLLMFFVLLARRRRRQDA